MAVAEFPAGDHLAAAVETVKWYLCRWEVEVYFRIYKSGCRVERLQLEISEHLEPALALYMIIAWRIQSIVMLGRAYPDLPCDVVFDDLEWRTAFVIRHHRPPTTPPRLADMITIIASFGGYLARNPIRLPAPRPSGSDYSVCGILLSREQPSIKSTEFVWNDVPQAASLAKCFPSVSTPLVGGSDEAEPFGALEQHLDRRGTLVQK